MSKAQFNYISTTCAANEAPVLDRLVYAALEYIKYGRINYDWGTSFELPTNNQTDEALEDMREHAGDILEYLHRMHKYGGEDIPLVQPLTEDVYGGGFDYSDVQVTALWWTWIYDVLAMLEEAKLNRHYLSFEEARATFLAGGEVWYLTDPNTYIGYDDDDEENDELATTQSLDDGDTEDDLGAEYIYFTGV